MSWSSFTKKINIKAPLQEVYKAWTTCSGIEDWFLRKAQFTTHEGQVRSTTESIQAGDQYEWYWHGFTDEVVEKNIIRSANGANELSFLFIKDCLVTVKLYTLKNQTIVAVTQSKIPDDNDPNTNLHVGCGEGWTFYLANLKSILEGGIDLRNKDIEISGVINS